MKCSVIIPAGGEGARFGGETPKQYLPLRGEAILARTIDRLRSFEAVSRVFVATPPGDRRWEEMSEGRDWSNVTRVDGGETRQQSVRNAFTASGCAGDDLVAIHDGVRPFVREGLLEELLAATARIGAAIPGIVVRDTIHEVDEREIIVGTTNRERLRAVQTPQCFRASILARALDSAATRGLEGTDEAALAVALGLEVEVVKGDPENMKITVPKDMERAEKEFDRLVAR